MEQQEQLEACRICVTCFSIKDMDFINIFQPNEEFQQQLHFIQGAIRHWELKILPDDGLPQRICANCFAKFCSIEAFREECKSSQRKLIETIMRQALSNETDAQLIIKDTDKPLPLVGNYETGNVSLDSGNNALDSSLNLTQADVSLTDFSVYDPQYDNPALMDASSTLLDNNLIPSETIPDLEFLPSQNLFTFETAEPPSTGTLPLEASETQSSINAMLVEKTCDSIIKSNDHEDILQHIIIPNTIKQTNIKKAINIKVQSDIKTDNNSQCSEHAERVKSEYQNTTITSFNHEDSNSDIDCDEPDMNARLKGLSYACHYCFCPEAGPIAHLLFPNEDGLSQHFFDVHDPNRPYNCPKCTQSFQTKLLRDNHVKFIHKGIEIKTCNYCQKRLNSSIDVHQYNCQYVGDWQCEKCKEKFANVPLFRFRLHQRQHERAKHFKCRLCERSFLRKANLEAHETVHKVEVQSTNTCHICKFSFLDDNELKRHNYRQHNAESPLKCKFCHKGFSSNVFLQRHINQFHSDNAINNSSNIPSSATSPSSSSVALGSEKQHICLNCSMRFKTVQKLQQHLVLGRDKNGICLYATSNKQERRKLQRQGVFPCFHCPRRFHLRSQLDKHLNTHDARLRPYQCEQCVMRCRTTFELRQHVNVAHLNIKAFSCDKCGKCFGYKKDLRDHMLFHAEINVRCTEEGCDYVCKNEKALNDHIRHKHRLLSCEYCNEQFTRQKLTTHLRKIHRSEIDVELASESDSFYKSQLLNNNNDITQISFNLLNAQQQEQQQLLKSLPQLSPSPTSMSSKNSDAPIVTYTSSPPSSTFSLTSTSLLNTSVLTSIATSPSLPTCLSSSTKGTHFSSNSNSTHNMINNVDQQHDQLCTIFASAHDTNGTPLDLNGLVSNENNLNLVANNANDIFLVPSTSSSANVNQFDQYFMASLMDTEQEIIVT